MNALSKGTILYNKKNPEHYIKLILSEAKGRLWMVEQYDDQDFIHICRMDLNQIEEYYQ